MKLSNTNIFKLWFSKDYDYIYKYVYMNNNTLDLKKHYDIALVLGCSNYNILIKRVDAVVELYNKKLIDKIYLSGKKGFFSKNKKSEAIIMKEYLLSKKIKEEDIITETNSKDTISNIKNSLKIINDNYNKKINIILVTSSFHMKRAKGLLENMCNHNIYCYPVNDLDNKETRKLIRNEAILLYLAVKNKKINDSEI